MYAVWLGFCSFVGMDTSKYVLIAIRDLPDLHSWRGSYLVGANIDFSHVEDMAKTEISARGGKYGVVAYRNDGHHLVEFGPQGNIIKETVMQGVVGFSQKSHI